MRALFPRDALFVRVYLFGLLLVCAAMVVTFLAFALEVMNRPEWEVQAQALERLPALIDNPPALERTLGDLARDGVHARVYTWDGERIAPSTLGDAQALTPEQRSQLRPGRALSLRSKAYPLLQGDVRKGYVVFEPHAASSASSPFSASRLAWVALLVLLVVAAVSYPMARAISAPISRLTQTARALGAGDLSARTGIRRQDDVGELAGAFDEMAERLEVLIRSEKELLANISHELRTPISRLRLALEVSEMSGDESTAKGLAAMGEDLAELEQLVEDVLMTARLESRATGPRGLPPLRLEQVNAAEVLAEAVSRFQVAHPERRLDVQLPQALPDLQADPMLLRRLVDNLLDNARKYSDAHEPVRLSAREEQGQLRIEVRDRGIGMQQADIQKVFTTFFRTDRSRARGTGGVGLGLALSRRIAEAHGGQLTVESMVGLGTVVRLHLPVQQTSGLTLGVHIS